MRIKFSKPEYHEAKELLPILNIDNIVVSVDNDVSIAYIIGNFTQTEIDNIKSKMATEGWSFIGIDSKDEEL